MVKKAIDLDTRHFDTVSDARAFFSVMLNRYPLGARVSDEAALLKRHSEVAEKTGVGLDHFAVRAPPPDSPPFSDRCFWVVRTDGSSIDFSIGHCLK